MLLLLLLVLLLAMVQKLTASLEAKKVPTVVLGTAAGVTLMMSSNALN